MFTKRTNKDELLQAIERLEKEVAERDETIESLNGELDLIKLENERKGKRIDCLDTAVSGYKKEAEEAKKQAAEYKCEIDNLADTKTVLDRLMSILRSPHNDYQKVVDRLENMLQQEKSRADTLEQELRNMQFDVQHNKFLDGKVQAYESMLKDQRLAVRSVHTFADSDYAKASEFNAYQSEAHA